MPKLNEKINSFDYPISAVINPMFVASLTDILNRQDWLQIFDHLVTRPFQPGLYITIGLAIVKCVEARLLKLSSVEEISISLRKEKNISMEVIIQEA